MTRFFDMSMEPFARFVDTIVASISGISPMARVIAKMTASRISSMRNSPALKYDFRTMIMNTGGTV